TTTTEAAGHSGGLYGRGGDILYRWGNPQAYDHGEDTDQQLFRQHDAEWITDEIPGAGNILIFNNGYGRPGNDYSSIIEIITPVGTDGNYTYTYGLPYEPIVPIWEYKAPNPSSFFSMILSGSQRLPNGNTLICNGYPGYFFEVTSYGEIVWDYTNPYPNSVQNQVFNLQQYQKNYPGLYHLQDNEPPEQPARPEGPSQGRKGETYTYTTYANDPEGQEIYYLFDWGDKTTSTWEGPYNSGEVVSMPHRWLSLQRIFKIRVKAMDSTGIESEWSLPLTVSMSVIKNSIIPWLSGFFSHHPILAWLVTLLNNLLPVLP
ncbi:MAG: hypothetical protein KKC68_06495, partial [Candidatus Thermoplasmatota archaeon]|nr:hypothetical protein [Candidatus Thermoplasmatota archaeon]MBU1941408.1 hypothetical protein [Candidatus Thermoplasmatota archaeon]